LCAQRRGQAQGRSEEIDRPRLAVVLAEDARALALGLGQAVRHGRDRRRELGPAVHVGEVLRQPALRVALARGGSQAEPGGVGHEGVDR
jgi:hypothetical protein